MNVSFGPSPVGLQHMAARAQEARSREGRTGPALAGAESPRRPETAGKDSLTAGKTLPAAAAARQQDHLTGPERAMERLQDAALKNPQAKGLQHALEMLQRRQDRHAVDTQA